MSTQSCRVDDFCPLLSSRTLIRPPLPLLLVPASLPIDGSDTAQIDGSTAILDWVLDVNADTPHLTAS